MAERISARDNFCEECISVFFAVVRAVSETKNGSDAGRWPMITPMASNYWDVLDESMTFRKFSPDEQPPPTDHPSQR